MEQIMTVTGAIAPDELGFCQSHEHLCILPGRSAEINPALRIDETRLSCDELIDYRAAGGDAVVDAQPIGCGRDVKLLEAISRESGVRIIASTGFHKQIFYPAEHWSVSWSEDQLTELYTSELTEGMFAACDALPPSERTKIRAGQIKTALDPEGLTAHSEVRFRAAARAARETGAPIMVHTEAGADSLALADLFEREIVELSRVIFCHLDRTEPDFEVHKELCRRGALLEYDTIAREKYHSDEREAELICAVLDAGHENRLLMSLDVTRERLLRYGGRVGLAYILKKFLPLLRSRGVSEKQLERIFRVNPSEAWRWQC